MSPPNGVKATSSKSNAASLSPAEERKEYLQSSEFFLDPSNAADPRHLQKKWEEDRDYRLKHTSLTLVLDAFSRFMRRDATVTPTRMKELIDAWTGDPEFAKDPINQVVLANMHRVLGRFESPDNAGQATKLRETLPPLPKPPEEKKPVEGTAAAKPVILLADPKKAWAIGLEFQNDSVPLAALDAAGVPLSAIANEKSYFTLKPTLDFPMGNWVGMVRLNGGMFESRGIPGENSKPGDGYRFGADFGLVNPYSRSHERSGLGLELTGVANHAGEEGGIAAPGPLARVHLFRESDWNIPIGGRFELGFSSFLNHQETYLALGGEPLLKDSPNGSAPSPFATSSSLFARSPLRWFGISGRYYLNGIDEAARETREDQNKPFRPGEGGPKLGNLWVGQIINMNRREDIPAFANTQVLLGTFWPLGMVASQQQFDTISVGLAFYSLQDGYFIAKNAQARGEIWRRDDTWWLRGLMLGGDAAMLTANIVRTAMAKKDPDPNQTMAEFVKDPGSVTDFGGRAGRINLELQGFELGLSALEISGLTGNVGDKNLTKFYATSGVAAGLGLLGFLFSGSISGNGCGPDGTLLRCSFFGQKDKYFKGGIDATPQNMGDIENQYVLSTVSAGLFSWGATRLLEPLFIPAKSEGDEKKTAKGGRTKKSALVEDIRFNVGVSPQGGQVTVGGKF